MSLVLCVYLAQGDRPASPPPGSPFGDRRLAITGRMAEVAKAAEALVDSVIRAAEDAVSQAMQGEGHGAPQVRPQTLGLF